MAHVFVDANDCMSGIDVKVELTGLRELRARLWLAAHIIKFAGWVAGYTTEVVVTTKT